MCPFHNRGLETSRGLWQSLQRKGSDLPEGGVLVVVGGSFYASLLQTGAAAVLCLPRTCGGCSRVDGPSWGFWGPFVCGLRCHSPAQDIELQSRAPERSRSVTSGKKGSVQSASLLPFSLLTVAPVCDWLETSSLSSACATPGWITHGSGMKAASTFRAVSICRDSAVPRPVRYCGVEFGL